MISHDRPFEILLIEDNPGDILLTQEALSETDFPNNLHVTMDGEEGLDFLYRRGKFENVVKPDLILLDLNMPKKDGFAVLEEIKADPDLKVIPAVVLTTSEAQQHIKKCYQLQANCYIKKPVDFANFLTIIQQIYQFWFTAVQLPVEKK